MLLKLGDSILLIVLVLVMVAVERCILGLVLEANKFREWDEVADWEVGCSC